MSRQSRRVFLPMNLVRVVLLPLFALVGGRLAAETYALVSFPVTGTFEAFSIASDGNGGLVYADGNATVGRVSASGVATVVAGMRRQQGWEDGVGATARFSSPRAVAVDSAGIIYVADTGNFTLRKVAPGAIVTTVAGQARSRGAVDGIGAAARLGSLTAMTLGPTGDLFVGDRGEDVVRIRRISPAGEVRTIATSPPEGAVGPDSPFSVNGIVADAEGNLYFVDGLGGTVRKMDPAGRVAVVAGAFKQSGTWDGVRSTAVFFSPTGIAWAADGSLLVIDTWGRTLRRVTLDGVVTTVAGQPYPNDYRALIEGVGGAASLDSSAIASDRAGSVYLLSIDRWLDENRRGSLLMKGTPTTAPSIPILTVSPLIDSPAASSNRRNVGAGTAVTFNSAAASSTPVSFQWMRNGVPVAGATRATLAIARAVGSDEGDYTVRISNAAGAYTSGSVALRVFESAFAAFVSRRSVPGGSFLWGIASGAGQLAAVGGGGKILTSVDGRTWVERDSGTTAWLVGVAYGAGKFVAVGDRGIILVSPDGVAWSRVEASGTSQRLNNVAYGATHETRRFVAVGEGGAIVTSADARTWTAQSSGVTTWLRGLTYDYDRTFYASGQNGVILEESASGVWRRVVGPTLSGSFNPTRDIEALAPGRTGPIGIGQDGWAIQREIWLSGTPHGFTTLSPSNPGPYYLPNWRSLHVGLAGRFRCLATGEGALFATGENGVIAAARNFDGPWSFIPTGTTANLVGGVFHGRSMFVVGENETILQSQPLFRSRFINISTRGPVVPGNPMIAGFVIDGNSSKQVLVRAAGPGLRQFGLAATVAAPTLTLVDSSGRVVAANSGWSTASTAAETAQAAVQVGAFPFAPGSLDSALVATLPPGSYTAQVTGDAGTALVEVYDAEGAEREGSRAVNLSTRAQVGGGEGRLIAGFVLSGAADRPVLIRAIGPSLAQFGVAGSLDAPQLELFDERGRRMQRAGAWREQLNVGEIQAATATAGAFALQEESRDAVILTYLWPGTYTVQVSGVDPTATGVALVEVYELP
jgi:hypothetical protein